MQIANHIPSLPYITDWPHAVQHFNLMIITSSTPITVLAPEAGMTTRAVNICLASGIETLADLLATDDESICQLPKCGRKSIDNLLEIKHRYNDDILLNTAVCTGKSGPGLFDEPGPVTIDTVLKPFFDNPDRYIDPAISDRFMAVAGNAVQFARMVLKEPQTMARALCDDAPHAEGMIQAYMTAARIWMDNTFISPYQKEVLSKNHHVICACCDLYRFIYRYYDLSQPTQARIQAEFESRKKTLSRRSQNILRFMDNVPLALMYIYGLRSINYRTLTNCGRKSEEEIEDFINQCRDEYDRFIEHISSMQPDVMKSLDRRNTIQSLTVDYPWLTPDQLAQAADALMEGRPYSPLYFLEKYILSSNSKDAYVFSHHTGFDRSQAPQSLETISDNIGISRERARQLFAKGIKVPSTLQCFVDELDHMLDSHIIGDDDPLWDELIARHAHPTCNLSRRLLLSLAAALCPRYEMVSFDDHSPVYIVWRSDIQHIRLLSATREIERKIACRRLSSQIIDIGAIIDRECDTTISDAQRQIVYELISRHIVNSTDARPVDTTHIMAMPTKFNIIEALTEILNRHGEPMDFDQLYESFARQYPGHTPRNANAFRSYIQRSKHIVPLGKTGRYILDSWEGHFTGTITDYLTSLLEDAPEPMHFDTLLKCTLEVFTRSNPTSCYSILAYHGRDRFAQFEGNFFGLINRDYGPKWHCYRTSCPGRQSFGRRLNQLERFLREHGRFPFSSGDEAEVSLLRWMRNVEKGRLTTESSLLSEKFAALIRDNAHLIQNLDEQRYSNMCDKAIEYVRTHHTLPRSADDIKLYSWYRKQVLNRDRLTGNTLTLARNMISVIDSMLQANKLS